MSRIVRFYVNTGSPFSAERYVRVPDGYTADDLQDAAEDWGLEQIDIGWDEATEDDGYDEDWTHRNG